MAINIARERYTSFKGLTHSATRRNPFQIGKDVSVQFLLSAKNTLGKITTLQTKNSNRDKVVSAGTENPPALTPAEQAQALLGPTWNKLSDAEKAHVVFGNLCPAGGDPERDYHSDNYFKKRR